MGVIENFIKDKEHTCIFRLTETKVESLDFDPKGVKLFTKHRNKEEKRGGGLIIGFKEDKEVKLEEIEIDDNDILALEGVVRGDINGRMTKLEPNIVTDANGKMLEEWATNLDMFHLNLTEQCSGKYTFQSKNGRSAIDHILVNERLFGNYLGMYIDEDKIQLDISDHCVVRAWFKINPGENKNWKSNGYKE